MSNKVNKLKSLVNDFKVKTQNEMAEQEARKTLNRISNIISRPNK